MSPVIATAICALLAAVVGGIILRRMHRPSARTLTVPDAGPPIAVWTGGMKTRSVNSTGGTARLELFDWGIRVRGLGPWRWLLPVWEARYEELTAAQMIKFPIANPGVLMHTSGAPVPLVFVTFRGLEIVDQLEARGVPVDRSVSRLRRADLDSASSCR
jgi:hypothetical protein